MGISTAETPPRGLDADWLGTWRGALKQLKEQGSWHPALKPLLDEYVRALRMAYIAFEQGEGGDRHSKRALAYAVELGLTPKARKTIGAKKKEPDAEKPNDPFAGLDEVGQKRQAKAKAG